MGYRKAVAGVAIPAALMIWCGSASATSAVIDNIQTYLYSGNTIHAAAVARTRLADVPGDDQARFALGVIQFLQAVEQLGQALHRYGLRTKYEDPTGLAGLPFLRIPVPENPDPEKVTYAALRAMLQDLVGDLEAAESTLAEIADSTIDLPLNIGLIRLDLDGDGAASDEEALWQIFKRVADFRWLNEVEARKLLTDFDGSDVPWLRAYCHLLMAIAEFPLAHDWQDTFEATFHGLFPKAGLPLSGLAESDAEEFAELMNLGRPSSPPKYQQGLNTGQDVRERRQRWLESPEGQRQQRIDSLGRRVEYAGIADLIAFLHLNHWPVVEPERMDSALGHLETMVGLSRENWRRIMAEIDDRSEWIPNPKQTGVLPRMRVTEERVAGWQQFLDEFEALLQGNKLLPHWRFDQGINLRRVFTEPTTFDIVLLIQGSAAVPYLEDGDLSTGETWEQIMNLFGGDFFRYLIWFN